MSSVLFDEYGERLRRLRRSEKSIYAYENAKTRFLEWCSEHRLDPREIESWQLEEYFAGLPFTPATKRNHLVQVSAAYNYALTRGVLGRNPARLVELPRVPDTTPRVLSRKTLLEMRDRCDNDDLWLLWHLWTYTGVRHAEGTRLHTSSIDLASRTIEVIGKGGKRRLVPIHPALGEVLADQKREGWLFPGRNRIRPLHVSTTNVWLNKIHPTATFHDFRRTVASSLDANGVEEGLIFQIMGWSRNTVFDRHYRNIAPERLQQAILKLYANDPI